MEIFHKQMINVNTPLLWLFSHKSFNLLIDLNSFSKHVLKNLNLLNKYVLATDSSQSYKGKLHDTS